MWWQSIKGQQPCNALQVYNKLQKTKDTKQQQFIIKHCKFLQQNIATSDNDDDDRHRLLQLSLKSALVDDNSQLTLGCNKLTVTAPLSLQDHDNDMEDNM